MDGTLADLGSAYADIEDRLFGPDQADHERPTPEAREAEQHATPSPATTGDNRVSERASRRGGSRNRERVWRAIEETPNFWTTLTPLEPGVVKRMYQLTSEQNWEVFFITQRPATAGATVQWQTQEWLIQQGFSMPSVIPLSGARGKCAAALQLDYLVDDTPQNCLDVLSDSSTRAILIVDARDPLAERSARRLGVGTARSVSDALDLLVQATAARANPSLFEKIRKLAGWK